MSIGNTIHGDIQSKIVSLLKEEGLELIELKVFLSAGKHIVRCVIDYPQGGVTIDECARINKIVFAYLTDTNLLGEDFVVEINSPGLDRPLKTAKDFIRATGKKVLLWLSEPVNGKGYYEGIIEAVNSETLILRSSGGQTTEIPLRYIHIGKLHIEV